MITRETLLKMKPGPKLNALVAENIMKWETSLYSPTKMCWHDPEDKKKPRWVNVECHSGPYEGFDPSKCIECAWETADKFTEFGFAVHCCRRKEQGDDKWKCVVAVNAQGVFVEARADTAPEAICKASLLACIGGE